MYTIPNTILQNTFTDKLGHGNVQYLHVHFRLEVKVLYFLVLRIEQMETLTKFP